MTFEEWWMLPKPAECDELKEVFRECWETASITSGIIGFTEGHEFCIKQKTGLKPEAEGG